MSKRRQNPDLDLDLEPSKTSKIMSSNTESTEDFPSPLESEEDTTLSPHLKDDDTENYESDDDCEDERMDSNSEGSKINPVLAKDLDLMENTSNFSPRIYEDIQMITVVFSVSDCDFEADVLEAWGLNPHEPLKVKISGLDTSAYLDADIEEVKVSVYQGDLELDSGIPVQIKWIVEKFLQDQFKKLSNRDVEAARSTSQLSEDDETTAREKFTSMDKARTCAQDLTDDEQALLDKAGYSEIRPEFKEMGFEDSDIQTACLATDGSKENMLTYLLEMMDIEASDVDWLTLYKIDFNETLHKLMGMGFEESKILTACQKTDGTIRKALEYLLPVEQQGEPEPQTTRDEPVISTFQTQTTEDGAMVSPGQTQITEDGTMVSPGQTQITEDGTMVSTGQTQITEDGTMVSTGQTQTTEDGTMVSTGQTQITEDGTMVSTGQTQITEDGTMVSTGQTQITEDGTMVSTGQTQTTEDGTMVSPGQTQITEDGTMVSTGQTQITEDGTMVSTGQTQTTEDGTMVSTFQTQTTEDGTMVSPGQTQTTEDGTMVSPGQTQTTEDGTMVSTVQTQTTEDGTMVSPGQTQTTEDGTMVSPGQTQTTEDGTMVSTGQTQTIEDGTMVSTGQTQITEDGTMVSTGQTQITEDGAMVSTGQTQTTEDGTMVSTGQTQTTEDDPNKTFPSLNQGFLMQLYKYIIQRIATLSDYCPSCDKHHDFSMLKPKLCSMPLCHWPEHIQNLHPDVTAYVSNHQKEADLLIQLTKAASFSSRAEKTLTPFPFILDSMTRKELLQEKERNFNLLRDVLRKFPPMSKIVDSPDMKAFLDSAHILCFPLLEWVINSCGCHIKVLPDSKHLHFMETPHQFQMLNSGPAKEKKFRDYKEKYGSTFAFYGSPIENWHTVVRQSLDLASGMRKQISGTGRAYSEGIYLTPSLQIALDRSRPKVKEAYNSDFITDSSLKLSCVALCEVIEKESYKDLKKRGKIWICSNNDLVCTRLLFLFDENNSLSPVCETDETGVRDEILKSLQ